MTLIHPGPDHRPRERCIGFGIPYDDGTWYVKCPRCKADVGQPCDRRGGRARDIERAVSHTVRTDRARNYFQGKAYRLFLKLENAALHRDPNGPLWSFQSLPHRCGTLGGHVLTDCAPLVEQTAR